MCEIQGCDATEPQFERSPADQVTAGPSRRTVLKSALALGGAAVAAGLVTQGRPVAARADTAPTNGDRVVMLGLDGGPMLKNNPPSLPSAKPALALVVNNAVYLVDCGFHTAQQMVKAGLKFGDLRNAFITHHHIDHTSGLPGLLLNGWTSAVKPLTSLSLWGPPNMPRKLAGIQTAFHEDIDLFLEAWGPAPSLDARNVSLPNGAGIRRVMEDDNVVVDATRVFHGPEVKNAYAYRFTIKNTGKSVVFSGDTGPMDANLITLAQGCDLLIHEVEDLDTIGPVINSFQGDPQKQAYILDHFLHAHTDVKIVPQVAQAAQARRVAFCHYAAGTTLAGYLSKAQTAADAIGYSGQILAPNDLDAISL